MENHPTAYYIDEANMRKLNKKYDWSVRIISGVDNTLNNRLNLCPYPSV